MALSLEGQMFILSYETPLIGREVGQRVRVRSMPRSMRQQLLQIEWRGDGPLLEKNRADAFLRENWFSVSNVNHM